MTLRRGASSCFVAAGLISTGPRENAWAADLAPAGVCMHEGQKLVGASPVLIGKSVRQPKKVRNAAFPAFNRAIVDAIRLWEFEPLLINGRATPACSTVTVTIDFL